MAIKNLFLVAATLCFLMVAVVAQGPNDPIIIANGTVTCSNNATADFESVPVEATLRGYGVRYEFTNSTGQFTISVPAYRIVDWNRRIIYPQEVGVNIIRDEEDDEELCPGGTLELEEAYVKARFGNYYVGNRIFRNGTRSEDIYERVF